MNTRRVLTLVGLTLAGALATGAAQASDRHTPWTVNIALPLPPLPLPPLPRVTIVQEHGGHGHPAWRDRDRDGVPNWRDGYDNRRDPRYGAWGDRDRDGIPNRYDRRDNRYDGRYDGRHDGRGAQPGWRHGPDRDRDGVPDWRDHRDNRR
jgi:hypothetical protein